MSSPYGDLPVSTPSALIELALADLEKVEADPRYQVDMCTWHQPAGEACLVCFAGSVLAKTVGLPIDADSDEFTIPLWAQALNEFRVGNVFTGLRYLGITEPSLNHWFIPTYVYDPAAFKAAMRALANELRGAGL